MSEGEKLFGATVKLAQGGFSRDQRRFSLNLRGKVLRRVPSIISTADRQEEVSCRLTERSPRHLQDWGIPIITLS